MLAAGFAADVVLRGILAALVAACLSLLARKPPFPAIAGPSVAFCAVYVASFWATSALSMLLLAGALGVVAAVLVGVILGRLRDDYLLLATLCLHFAVSRWARSDLVGGPGATGRPLWGDSSLSAVPAIAVVAVTALIIGGAVWHVERGPLGAQLALLRGSPAIAVAHGINAQRWFLVLWSTSVGAAAVGAAAVACYLGVVSGNTLSLGSVLLPLAIVLALAKKPLAYGLALAFSLAVCGELLRALAQGFGRDALLGVFIVVIAISAVRSEASDA